MRVFAAVCNPNEHRKLPLEYSDHYNTVSLTKIRTRKNAFPGPHLEQTLKNLPLECGESDLSPLRSKCIFTHRHNYFKRKCDPNYLRDVEGVSGYDIRVLPPTRRDRRIHFVTSQHIRCTQLSFLPSELNVLTTYVARAAGVPHRAPARPVRRRRRLCPSTAQAEGRTRRPDAPRPSRRVSRIPSPPRPRPGAVLYFHQCSRCTRRSPNTL